MTQVWMCRNSDTDIHIFNRREHLLPSVELSFSRCKDVKVEKKEEFRNVTYTVTGTRDDGPFEEKITFQCIPVWTEPSHL